MTTIHRKPQNITEYINAAPEAAQDKLWELLACLRNEAPGAQESLKWGQPALSYKWILFQFAAYKNHISLFPTPSVVKAFEKELSKYKYSSSTIQFPLDQPLPIPLIRKLAQLRLQEAAAGVKWM